MLRKSVLGEVDAGFANVSVSSSSGSASDPDSERVTSIEPETLRQYFIASGIIKFALN